MISSDVIRGYNDIMILCLLLDEESYGYEISKQILKLTNGKYKMKETTLYSAFTRLERNGHISSFAKQENSRRTYYRITDNGIKFYKEKCKEWKLTKEVVEKFIKEE